MKTPVEMRFSLPGLNDKTKVRRLFGDGRDFKVSDGGSTDKLKGYGTRAYEITGVTVPAREVLEIELDLKPDPVEKPAEKPEATVWLDAAQFEEGTEPTEYIRDIYIPGNDVWRQAETPN